MSAMRFEDDALNRVLMSGFTDREEVIAHALFRKFTNLYFVKSTVLPGLTSD